jgi:serine phosphatase RsbU (regulator of sigma subunit)
MELPLTHGGHVSEGGSGNQELTRCFERIRRLEAVVEASLMVNSTLDLTELAAHIVDIATRLINAERGSLFMVDKDDGSLRSLVAQGVAPGSLRLEMGEGIVGSVAKSGQAEILDQPYDDPRFDPEVDRRTGYVTRSLLTVPVRDRDGRLRAVLQLLNHGGDGFSREDVEFLAELGVPFAIALTTARLHTEIVAREQLERELKLAADIQRNMQPVSRASIPGLEIDVLFRPSREVGGDYWDVIPLGDQRWWIVVGDVSGKGVAAGLVASNLQACLWSSRKAAAPLPEIVTGINELLGRLTRGRKYATMVILEWDSDRETLSWVNAGHPPLLHERDGEVREYGATGRPVGLLANQHYDFDGLFLEEGDTLLLYSDGILEADGGDGRGEFGLERMCDQLPGDGGPHGVIVRLSAAVADHLQGDEPGDDLTLVCVRRVKA